MILLRRAERTLGTHDVSLIHHESMCVGGYPVTHYFSFLEVVHFVLFRGEHWTSSDAISTPKSLFLVATTTTSTHFFLYHF